MPQGATQKIAHEVLGESLRRAQHFGMAGAVPGRPCIRLEDAVIAVADRLPCRPDQRQFQALVAITSMVAKGMIERRRMIGYGMLSSLRTNSHKTPNCAILCAQHTQHPILDPNVYASSCGRAAARASSKSTRDLGAHEMAQRGNRVRHMALCPAGCREVCNLRVRQALLVDWSFFWKRSAVAEPVESRRQRCTWLRDDENRSSRDPRNETSRIPT